MTSTASRGSRARAYLRRLVFVWVAEDPSPAYSTLDKLDGPAMTADLFSGRNLTIAPDLDSQARREQWRNARRMRRGVDGCMSFAIRTAAPRRAA
jgi:hypothetical protein